MRIIALTTALVLGAAITPRATAAELPAIGFEQPGWTMTNHVALTDGVLTIAGGDGYRAARFELPAAVVGAERFYFTVDVRLRDIAPGPELYMKPKVKLSQPGPPKRSVRNFHSGECETWTQVTIDHKLLNGQLPESVTVEVAIQDCGGIAEFRAPHLSWTHPEVRSDYPFERPAEVGASLAIDTAVASPFNTRLLGTNQQWTWSPIGYEAEVVQAFVRATRPPSLRFPAGTVANYYDWTTDGFAPPGPGQGPGWIGYVIKAEKRFAFNDYLALCQELGLSSPLTFNVLADSDEDSIARLRDRLDRGTPIEHIELGNENYFDNQRGGRVETVEDYIAVTRGLAPKLKAIAPEIPIAVNIAGEDDSEIGEMARWNAAIAAAGGYYDAVVLHPYRGIPQSRPDTDAISRMLRLAPHLRQRIAACHEQFGVPILVTEWGILAPDLGSESVAAAIGIADGFLALIDAGEAGIVRSACLHLLCLADGAVGSGIYGLDKATKTFRVSRRGAVYELALAAFRDAQLLGGTCDSAELAPDLPAISARAARRSDGSIAVYAVNKLDVAAPFALAIDGVAVTAGTITSYVEDSLAEGVLSWPLGEQPLVRAEIADAIELPPLSVSLIELAP